MGGLNNPQTFRNNERLPGEVGDAGAGSGSNPWRGEGESG